MIIIIFVDRVEGGSEVILCVRQRRSSALSSTFSEVFTFSTGNLIGWIRLDVGVSGVKVAFHQRCHSVSYAVFCL